jgi:hypothetical protein
VVGGGKFANGAQTGAFRYLFNESMHHGQKQGIPISEYERRLAKKETQMSRMIFWHSRYSSGDPLAETALDVVANIGFRGKSANLFSTNDEQTGINLMVDYVNYLPPPTTEMVPPITAVVTLLIFIPELIEVEYLCWCI